MTSLIRPFRSRPSRRDPEQNRRRFALESLEPRTLLSQQPLALTATQSIRATGATTLITVPGNPGQMVTVTFALDGRFALYRNEMGMFPVSDATGRIGALAPGSPGYIHLALTEPGARVVFRNTDPVGTVFSATLPAGSIYGLYLVANGTTRQALAHCGPRPHVYTSIQVANPDRFNHLRVVNGSVYFWEDLYGGGDSDFNDLITNVTYKINGGGGGGTQNHPPVVTLTTTPPATPRNQNLVIQGRVTDPDNNARTLQVQVDGKSPVTVAFDPNSGAFSFPTGLKLDGSADGTHTFRFVATDAKGLTSAPVTFTYTLDTLAPAVSFDLAPESASPGDGPHVSDLGIVSLVGHTDPRVTVTLVGTGQSTTSDSLGNFRFINVSLPLGETPTTVTATDAAGNVGSATQTLIHCGIAPNLSGWTPAQQGGSAAGKGTVVGSNNDAVLTEGDSFVTDLSSGFTIPAGATKLTFDLDNLKFDTTATGGIKDAFEVALVDGQGRPIVPTFTTGRDAFYNNTEGLGAVTGAGTTVNGSLVSVDLSKVAPGTAARLIFRLVNNDTDTRTTASVGCAIVHAGAATFVIGAPGAPGLSAQAASTTQVAPVSTNRNTSGSSTASASTTTSTSTAGVDTAIRSSTSSQGGSTPSASNGAGTSGGSTSVGPVQHFAPPPGNPPATPPTSAGTEFWIGFPGALIENGQPVQTLFITGDVATTGNVSIPGLNYSQDFTVTPGQVTTLTMPDKTQVETLATIENKGIHIVAKDPVTVYGLSSALASSDAYLALPLTALGTHYIDMSYAATSHLISYLPTSQVTIVGTQDNTSVTITPGSKVASSTDSVVNVNRPGGSNLTGNGGGTDTSVFFADTSGTYTVSVTTPFSDYAGTYKFQVIDLDKNSTPIALGQTATANLPTGEETVVYRFNGTVGQTVAIDSLTLNTPNTDIQLYSPSERELFSNNASYDSDATILPESGTYYVLVTGHNAGAVTTSFRVVDLSAAPTLTFGSTVSGTLPTGLETMAYTFTGTAGQTLSYDALVPSDGHTQYQFLRPDGTSLTGDLAGNDSGLVVLPTTGTYHFVLHGGVAQASPFSFRVFDLATVPSLALGATTTASAPTGYESTWYNVDLTAGQSIYYSALGPYLNGSAVRLYDPNGNRLIDNNVGQQPDPLFITRTGQYRLQISVGTGAATTVPFRLVDVNASAAALTLGTPTTAALPSGQDTVFYKVSLTAGQQIVFDNLKAGVKFNPILLDPAGNRVGLSGLTVAPLTGTYILAIQGTDTVPASAKFALLNLTAAPTLTLGATNSGTLATGNEDVTFQFHGTAGQRLIYNAVDTVGGAGNVAIYGPGQKTALYNNGSSNSRLFTLGEDGTYTLVLFGSGTAGATYKFRLIDTASAPALDLNGSTPGTLNPATSLGVYRLSATGAQSVALSLSSLSDPNAGSWGLYGPDNGYLTSGSLQQTLNAKLAQAGTYVLLLDGSNSTKPSVSYTVAATTTADPAVAPSGFGVQKTLTIAAGATATYQFSAPAGRVVLLDSLNASSSNLHIVVTDPSGKSVIDTNDTTDSDPLVLRASGTYTLTVSGNSPQAAGSYSFRVLDLSGAPVLTPGSDTTGNLDLPLGTIAFRVAGTAGQRYFYNGLGTDFSNVTTRFFDTAANVLNALNYDNQSTFGPLTQTGDHFLLLTSNVTSQPTYHFRLLDMSAGPALTFDTDTTGSLDTGKSAVVYHFTGTAGQALYYDGLPPSNANIGATLVGPGDTQVFGINGNNDSAPFVLTQSGTYTLTIQANAPGATTYGFNLRSTAPTISLGANVALNLGPTGDATGVYTINGTSGQTLAFDALTSTTNSASVTILDPNGRYISSRGNFDDLYPLLLGSTGKYTLIVSGYNGSAGTVNFRVLDANAGTTITPGTPVTGNLPDGQESIVYRLNVTAGHSYYFNGLNPSANSVSAEVYTPGFQEVIARGVTDNFGFTATSTGAYYLVVRGQASNPTPFAFNVLDLNGAPTLTLGQEYTGTQPTGREYLPFQFAGIPGQTIYLDGLGAANTSAGVRIIAPSGNQLVDTNANSDAGPFTLTEGGDYALLVTGNGSAAANYDFRLLDAASATPVTAGTPVAVSLSNGNTTLYSLDLTAAESVVIHPSNLTPSNANATWYLYDPSNRDVTSQGIGNDITATTLRTGRYLLAVISNQQAPVSLNFTATITPVAPVAPSGVGVVQTMNLKMGETQTYTFNAPAGERLYLDAIQSTFTIPVQTITLNTGQTYQLRDLGGGDVTGTEVTSDKPIAVFGGNLASFVPDGYAAADHLVQQLPATTEWGRDFLTYPLATRTKGDTFRFLAQADNTVVTVNGAAVATLNKDQFFETILTTPSQIHASHPILVAQFSNSSQFDNTTSDPFMAIVPPSEQFLDHYTITTANKYFNINYANVVAPAAEAGQIQLDGTAIPASQFHPIGTSGYVGASVPISVGSHDFVGTGLFGLLIYGFAPYDGYGYIAGETFSPVAAVDSVTVSPASTSKPVGGSQVFTATLLDVSNKPVAGVRVDFTVAGANPSSGFAYSDGNGQAVYTVTGAVGGTDTVIATVSGLTGQGSIRWKSSALPPTVTVTDPAGGSSFTADTDVTLSGVATADVPDASLVLVTVNGTPVDALDAAGHFFAKIHIGPGQNAFHVVATDSLGHTAATDVSLTGVVTATGSVDWSRFADVSGSFAASYARTSYDQRDGSLYADIAVKNSGQYDADAPLLVAIANISDPSVRVLDAAGVTPQGAPYYDFTGLVTGGRLHPAGQSGFLSARFDNPNHARFTYQLVFLGQLNQSPIITSVPGTEAIAGRAYSYAMQATDPNGDTLHYTLLAGPSGATLNPTTGALAWSPVVADLGSHDVSIQVDDGRGGLATQHFVLIVENAPPSRPPVFTSTPVVVGHVGSPYSYQATGLDYDGNPLTFTVAGGPKGLLIDPKTGLVTWTPTVDQLGNVDVALTLSDGQGGTATQQFQVCLQPGIGSHAPVIVGLPPAFATPGSYSGKVVAHDADPAQSLSYSLDSHPAGMTIDPVTGVLTWNPTSGDLGAHPVIVRVKDGLGNADVASFSLVVNSNHAPKITSAPVTTATVGKAYQFDVVATDPDAGDVLTYSLASAPPGMTINPSTGRIDWVPGATAYASSPVVVRVDDGAGGSDQLAFTIKVSGGKAVAGTVNPTFTSTPVVVASVGSPFRYAAAAWTPTGNPLTFDLASAPAGMVVDPVTGVVGWGPASDQVGPQTVVLRVQDGKGGMALQSFVVQVAAADTPPVITSTPHANAWTGLPWVYRVAAQDAQGHSLKVTVASGPSGLTVKPWPDGTYAAELAWTPTAAGTVPVTISVDDGHGGVTTQSFTLNVNAPATNQTPVISSKPRVAVAIGQSWTYPVVADDADGDPLTFALDTGAPAAMTIDPVSGRLAWTPSAADVGDHTVKVIVTDGRGGQANQSFSIHVGTTPVNAAPTIVSTPPASLVPDGKAFAYDLLAVDPDNDPVTWSLDSAPQGVSIDPARGNLRWTPGKDQLGPQTIVVRATDPYGASSTQAIHLAVECSALPPQILSKPVTTANNGTFYVYGVRAIDPQNETLSYTLDKAPAGMTIDPSSGVLTWTPTAAEVGTQQVALRVTNADGGVATQQFSVVVGNVPLVQPPVITSVPPLRALIGSSYTYQVQAVDPQGQSVTFSLITPPTGMSIDSLTGRLTWKPTSAQVGVATVTVAADNTSGFRGTQSYNLLVRVAQPPVITSTAVTTGAAGATYHYDVQARSPIGEKLTYSLTSAPTGMTIDDKGRITWATGPHDAGSHPFTVVVTDDLGASVTQPVALNVAPDTQAPTVAIQASSNPVKINTTVTVVVQASDNVGVASTSLTLDGQPVVLDANGGATFTFTTGGLHTLVATATDASGNDGTARLTLRAFDPSNTTGPTVTITSPVAGAIVSTLTPIVGTIGSPNLASYRVEYARADLVDVNDPTADNPAYQVIAQGTKPVTSGTLATFDPAMLLNDSYVIRVIAFDTNGNVTAQVLPLSVEGNRSFGQFAISATDLSLSIAGLPVSITRKYDTRNAANEGDFGFGWSLAVADPQIRETIPVTDLQFQGLGYAAIPFHDGVRVFITSPSGRREGFTFSTTPQFSLFGGGYFLPKFTPDPGVTDTLSVDPTALVRSGNGDYSLQFLGIPFNPGFFNLTTRDGTTYRYDRFNGLQSVTSRAGVTLTYSPDGIVSSTGETVKFDRDPQGRIVKVEAPGGLTVSYTYNAAGDLTSVTDATGRATTYGYLTKPAHYLNSITDASGNVQTAKYDAQGRLIGLADSKGNVTTTSYDTANNSETVTDALGNVTKLQFDDNGNVTSTTDALGHKRTFTFDASNNLTSVTDPAGNKVTMTYDAGGNVTSTTDANGGVQTITYDSHNEPVSVTDALGHVATSQYDAAGHLIKFVNALGQTSTTTYDSMGRIATITDNLGHTTSYTYTGSNDRPTTTTYADGTTLQETRNAQGLITGSVNANGGKRSYTYDASGRPLTSTDPLGNTTKYAYNAAGQLVSVTDPLGNVTKYGYDTAGNRTTVTDPTGHTITTTYNSDNLPIAITCCLDGQTVKTYYADGKLDTETDADGNKRSYTYDATGNMISATDGNGGVTTFTYDAMGHQTSRTDPLGNKTTWAYDANGNLISQTDPTGAVTRYAYDALNRLIAVTDASGNTTRQAYDAAGDIVSQTDSLGQTTQYTYDARGRRLTMTDPRGNVTSYGYDAVGNLTTITDPQGHVTKRQYDAAGRLISATSPDGNSLTYTLDADGRATSITDAQGHVTRMTYDGDGHVLTIVNPDGGVTSYAYNDEGQRSGETDPDGNVTTWTYDCVGRLLSRTVNKGTTTYTYDNVGNLISYTDATGRVVTYTYNADNQVTNETSRPGVKAPDADTITYTYDAAGRVLSEADKSSKYTFTYDTLGRVTSVDNDGTPNVPHVVLHYAYDANGRIVSTTDNAGVSVTNSFNTLGQLASEVWQGGGVDAARVNFAYDANGQLESLTRYADAAGTQAVITTTSTYSPGGHLAGLDTTTPGGATVSDYVYTYDSAGHLATETHHGQTWTYTYDKNGQILSATLAGSPAASTSYSYDAQGNRTSAGSTVGANNQLTSNKTFRYTYDAAGNLTLRTRISDGSTTAYSYDTRGRLVGVIDRDGSGKTVQTVGYTYDVFDRRIGKTVDGHTTYTVYDGDHPWADYDGTGTLVARYLSGPLVDNLLARDTPGKGLAFYVADRLGTIRDITDATGKVIDHIDYDAYGQVTGETNPAAGDRFKYTGQVYDVETGLDYFRARYYDPGTGRFLTPDSLGFRSGDTNLYRYVGNDPTNAIDPTGHQAIGEYVENLAAQFEVGATAIEYGGDKPVTFTIGAMAGGQPFVGISASPSLSGTLPIGEGGGVGLGWGLGPDGFPTFDPPKIEVDGPPGTSGSFGAEGVELGSPFTLGLGKIKIPLGPGGGEGEGEGGGGSPDQGEFQFLVVSTAKTPNFLASWNTAVYGGVATELSLIAKVASADDSSTVAEVEFHEKIPNPDATWDSHGFATIPHHYPDGGPGGPPPPPPPSPPPPGVTPPGSPPNDAPPDDGDDGEGDDGEGDGEGDGFGCNAFSGFVCAGLTSARSYLSTPYVTSRQPAFRDPCCVRLLDRLVVNCPPARQQ